jgi:hypothetical protein
LLCVLSPTVMLNYFVWTVTMDGDSKYGRKKDPKFGKKIQKIA